MKNGFIEQTANEMRQKIDSVMADVSENTNGATLETRIDSESFQYQCKETIIGCKNWCGKTICMIFKAKERNTKL